METTGIMLHALVIVMAILNTLCTGAGLAFVVLYACAGDRDKAVEALFRAMMNAAVAVALFFVLTMFK